jgi:hypothetical protein
MTPSDSVCQEFLRLLARQELEELSDRRDTALCSKPQQGRLLHTFFFV